MAADAEEASDAGRTLAADADRASDRGRTLAADADRASDRGRTSLTAGAERPCDAAFVYEDFTPGDFGTRDHAFVYALAPADRTRAGFACAPAAVTGRACDGRAFDGDGAFNGTFAAL
jgi:hypothetical protein